MSTFVKVGQVEKATQDRVVKLFTDALGYQYLGHWQEETRRAGIEEATLRQYLRDDQGYAEAEVAEAIRKLRKVAENSTDSLYTRNRAVYQMLRYGVKVQPDPTVAPRTVQLVQWHDVAANRWGVAQEVTVAGPTHTKRPDVVLYLNGIAVVVLELKRSTVPVAEAIRQNLDNQQKLFVEEFYVPVQLVLAGNDTEGLRYGTTGTKEKYFLEWREDFDVGELPAPPAGIIPLQLDEGLRYLCSRERLLTLLHDFIVFDGGLKKLCRPNQYFGVRAAQRRVGEREGGIIWHTQGSGKSLTMVWLAKWLLEFDNQARVLIITDRKELDEQIEQVFLDAEETIYRADQNGRDLLRQLSQPAPRLLCSLVHKFGNRSDEDNLATYIADLMSAAGQAGAAFRPQGRLFVFVDECHRTQSGKLHAAMKRLLPEALFIGFTGTPLLKKDRQTSLEVFGRFIHTYRVDEAVRDGVVLELRYEARKVEQFLPKNTKAIDDRFTKITAEANDFAKTKLKERWGTMQKVLSSKERMTRIVDDIVRDMSEKERLRTGRGNAILVTTDIERACRYYELFQDAGFTKCAIITSYQPSIKDLKGETTGEGGLTNQALKHKVYTDMLKGQTTEAFEIDAKELFKKQPANMRLLIVVSKLLTGFDAPSASYLYIDKEMRDHDLFQAICRVNRLDGEDKQYGYIVDYKDLFKALEKTIKDYTSEAFADYKAEDIQGLLTDRIEEGRADLEVILEQLRLLCQDVPAPRDSPAYQQYFCGTSATPNELSERAGRRRDLYKYTGALLRAFDDLKDDLEEAGYTMTEAAKLHDLVGFYADVREEVKIRAAEAPDLKRYEADMRYLLDTYVRAEDAEKLGDLTDMSLIELILAKGASEAVKSLPKNIRQNKQAMAETIENNVRRLIIDENPTNPIYFGNMSKLLEELIARRQQEDADYEQYLIEMAELCQHIKNPPKDQYPAAINTAARRAFYDGLSHNEELAIALDTGIRDNKEDNWRVPGSLKLKRVRLVIKNLLPDPADIDRILDLAIQQGEY
jgi:type I restriction enzyme R subunit